MDPSHAVPVPGEVLAGQYRIDRWLGDGGMGLVLAARDLRLHRDVAIKMVQPRLAGSPSVRRAFEREARAMAALCHPNLVTIHAYAEDAGRPFLVLELVDGPSLAQVLRERGRLSPVEALPILRAVAEGLTALHAHGLVHGDVKPANVMLGADGAVKLTDMGIARLAGEPRGGEVQGTPSYMPPERGRDLVPRDLLRRQDVYSLGVTTYEVLTGRVPHDRGVPPSQVYAELGPRFDAPILDALRADPAERTATPLELIARLESARARPARLLVVDDDEEWLAVLALAIERHLPGVEVTLARGGEEALAIAREDRPAAALVDLRMPRGDGEVLTRELRAIAGAAEMPIVVVTGEGGGAEWRRLRRLGADRFFVKPVPFDELCRTLQSLLAGAAAH